MQTCQSCTHQNKDTAKFCASCGQQLTNSGPLHTSRILQSRYRMMHLLGSGGFGAVYQAQDLRLGNRLVAVKENFDSSPDAQEQFYREANMLANLKHAHLPAVTDHFIEAPGKQYLVMDFIEGQDVENMLERNAVLPETQALRWFDQVCDAVHYLHKQEPPIIHRDIKPGNIRISPNDKAILVDFGIAKQEQQGKKTMAAARAITAGFSPPEQYGSASTDARSDVYALGATLYAMLTGQSPPDAMDRITSGIRLIPPRQLNEAISPNTEQVILRSLEISATKRQQSVQELRDALASSSQHSSQPISTPVQPSQPSKPFVEMAVQPSQPNRPFVETPVQPSQPNRPFIETPVQPGNLLARGQQQVAHHPLSGHASSYPATSSPALASFGQRFVAFLIDGLFVTIAYVAFVTCAGVIAATNGDLGLLLGLLTPFTSIFYYTYFHASSGQTPGKKLLRIKVVSTDGSPISTGQAIGRCFGYGISSLFLSMGYLWILIDQKNQAWHDKITGTYVINI